MIKTPKKYERGDNPCGKCQMHRHYCCRPRLDGSMCSCQCPASRETHSLKEKLDAERASRGLALVTVAELYVIMQRRGPYRV